MLHDFKMNRILFNLGRIQEQGSSLGIALVVLVTDAFGTAFEPQRSCGASTKLIASQMGLEAISTNLCNSSHLAEGTGSSLALRFQGSESRFHKTFASGFRDHGRGILGCSLGHFSSLTQFLIPQA